jgi:hypothetical protein
MAGQPLKIRNNDATNHNINAQPERNKGFNFSQPTKGKEDVVTFDKQEVMIKVRCDIHDWMNAYVGVVSHPYFAVTGSDGTIELKNLPPGSFTIEAWHEVCGAQTREIKLADKGSETIEFTFEDK